MHDVVPACLTTNRGVSAAGQEVGVRGVVRRPGGRHVRVGLHHLLPVHERDDGVPAVSGAAGRQRETDVVRLVSLTSITA